MLSLISSGAKEIRRNAIVSDDMVRAIEYWERMYRGEVSWRTPENPDWLNLPGKIAAEIATKVTNEVVIRIQPSEETNAADGIVKPTKPMDGAGQKTEAGKALERWQYIDKVLKPVRTRLSVYTEYACAFGGICFKPYINGNNEIAVSVFNASRFYPTAFTAAQEIQSGFFLDQKKQGEFWYCRVEQHEWDGVEKYTVKNTCYRSQSPDALGNPCPLAEVEDWKNIQPVVEMEEVHHPLFAYFGIPLGNTVDQTSPLGVSVYHRAIDNIMAADKQYQRLIWEYEGGEMAVDISEDALGVGKNGEPIIPKGKERLFRTNGVPVTASGNKLLEVFAPTLRDASYTNGLQTALKIVEDDASLARGTFSDPEKDTRTATEIRQQKHRTYDTVHKIQESLDAALHNLAHAIDAMLTLYGICQPGKWAYSASWDDSVIEDTETERMNDRDDVRDNLMAAWEYRVKWYGETEEQARKAIKELEKPSDDDIMGFNAKTPPAEPGTNDGAQK